MDNLCDLCLVFNFNVKDSGKFCDNFQQEKENQKLGKLTLVLIKLVDFILYKHIFNIVSASSILYFFFKNWNIEGKILKQR